MELRDEQLSPLSFEMPHQLEQWLKRNHKTEQELWVRIFKKGSGTPTVTWEDCVISAIAWGWIDGQRKSFDEVSFIQRLTPRRPRSNWSKRNTKHAKRLIAEGRMQPAGLAHIETARKDGRWDNAYSGSAQMVMPPDFLRALKKVPKAQRFFETLSRAERYAIYHRLQTAKRQDTGKKRVTKIISQLMIGRIIN